MFEVLLFQSLKETTGGDTSFKNTLKVYQLNLYCLTAVKYLPETNVSTIHFRHLKVLDSVHSKKLPVTLTKSLVHQIKAPRSLL